MTYTTKQAADAAGIKSTVTVRNYTRDPRLIPFFSDTATATDGKPRQMTIQDVKTLKFIVTATARGETIPDVVKRLDSAEFKAFNWSPPDPPGQNQRKPQQDQERSNTALMDPATLMLLQTIQQQFSATREREAELQQQLIESERARAIAEAELAQLKQRRSLWQRLFGH